MDAHQHIVTRFDEELARIEGLLVEMADVVQQQLLDAAEALKTGDEVLANKVRRGDKAVNDLETRIDELTVRLIALRQPMADDLRSAISTLKVSNNLERMGDYAKTSAIRTPLLSELTMAKSAVKTLRRMSKEVAAMLGDVMKAYVARDWEAAAEVRARDEDVDQMYSALLRELLTYMMENPRNIEPSFHMLFLAKNLERAGDQVTNIAEQVYFLTTGEVFEEGVLAQG